MASMYSHTLEETVVVEAIANSLDAGCSTISFEVDASRSRLVFLDDGRGMTEQEFSITTIWPRAPRPADTE